MSTHAILNDRTLAKLQACVESGNVGRATRIVYRMIQELEKCSPEELALGNPNRYQSAMAFAKKTIPVVQLAVFVDKMAGYSQFLEMALEREREFLTHKHTPTFLANVYSGDEEGDGFPIVLDSPVCQTWEELIADASSQKEGCKFEARVEGLTIWAYCSEHKHTIRSDFRHYNEAEFLVLDPLAV